MNAFNEESTPYQKAIEIAKDNIRFSYLWPAKVVRISEKITWDSLQTLFPFSITRALEEFYPNPVAMKKEEFEYTFMGTEQRTSINPDNRTAEEGILFEVESITNHTRNGEQVFLVGILWISDMAQGLEKPEELLSGMILGGERTYGWGRGILRIEQVPISQTPNEIEFEGNVPSHLISDSVQLDDSARVETLAGWEMKDGHHSLTHLATYEPGCLVEKQDFEINEYGIWVAK
jgi:hypothetical protein